MKESDWQNKQILFRWLALAALAEWLISRTATRAAIHVPKSPVVISIYQAFNLTGQVAGAFVTLLVLVLIGWITLREWQTRRALLLPLALMGLVALSLLFLVSAPSALLATVYHLLTIGVVMIIARSIMHSSVPATAASGQYRIFAGPAIVRFAILFPALALLTGVLYQLLPTLFTALNWPGPPPLTGALFNIGEVLVVLSVAVLWWFYGRTASWCLWLLAAVPAALFTLSFQRDPAMTGILAIWSTGLTLFLPWPMYAMALLLVGITALATWRRNPSIAYACLLLASAGYAPQLSAQLFCALIALWLLARQVGDFQYPLQISSQAHRRLRPATAVPTATAQHPTD